MLVARPGVRVPQLHRRVDVQHALVVAPLHDLAAVDVPGQVDEEVAGREMFAEERAQIVLRDAVLDEGDPPFEPGPQRRLVRIELHDGDALRIDVEVAQQDGQCAPRDGAKAHEQNSMRKCQHPLAPMRIELLHQHLGMPAALLVLLPARRRQVVRRAFDKAAFGLKIREGLGRERQQFLQAQFARPVFHELNQLAPDALVLVR